MKPYQIKPRVIFMKNIRDRVILMSEKRKLKDVPTCEHGYFGGFSPKRDGPYKN